MKSSHSLRLALLAALLWGCDTTPPAADIAVPSIFGDHMVLQRDMNVPVWGTALPGGTVRVEIDGQSHRARVAPDSTWRVDLAPLQAGGPYELVIAGADTTVFSDVLVGEVWVGSGQSNMEMPLAGWGRVKDYEKEIAAASFPPIRLWQAEHTVAFSPQTEVPNTGWQPTTPETVAEFSSVAYFFGRDLHRTLDVPIGLIHSSWGGTIAEAWTSAGALREMPDFVEAVNTLAPAGGGTVEEQVAAYDAAMARWRADARASDAGRQDADSTRWWYQPGADAGGWKTMEVPRLWEEAGLPGFDGVVWFRREVTVPASWAGRDLTLNLGLIDDNDDTWFNGVRVGGIAAFNAMRTYTVPGALVKAGRNVIAVRIEDTGGGGGFYGDPGALSLGRAGAPPQSLAGVWMCRVGYDVRDLPPQPASPRNPNQVTVLYNGMLAPIIPYGIRGAIWYQGESNTGRAYQYRTLFPTMISDWRAQWGQGDFPFLFVQLANFKERPQHPVEDDWAELREAQTMTLSLPNTGMAVTIDIGEAADIHPKNKQEVGRRLALLARRQVYGEALAAYGPVYRSMTVEGPTVRLTFDHADGLAADGGQDLEGFTIAGADRVFHWAEANIDGETVNVYSPDVAEPVAVRYGWAANPAVNLVNGAGLPASPFRTDDWPGITAR
ncbi:MAG: sialate O-acetylesterase [Rhodothermales bacterium]